MGVFGPKYPPQLQAVVNHAERFCELLARLEHVCVSDRGREHEWLVGRRQEVEAVVVLIVGDWAAACLGLERATRELAAYLADVHAGAQNLPLAPVLRCCAEDES